MKTTINPELIRLMAARGTSPKAIIEQLGLNTIHASQVFLGRKSGRPTRKRLARLMTPEELAVLGWDCQGGALSDMTVVREDLAIGQVLEVLRAYQGSRDFLRRIVKVVAGHPELFGPVAEGGNYIEMAARKLEEIANDQTAQGPMTKENPMFKEAA